PVEVVATRAPGRPLVFGDGDLQVGVTVRLLHVAVGASDRQLPADVGLGLQRVAVLLQGERVQSAAAAARESGTVGEDARILTLERTGEGLAVAVFVGLDAVFSAHRAAGVLLPRLGGELVDVRRDAGFV